MVGILSQKNQQTLGTKGFKLPYRNEGQLDEWYHLKEGENCEFSPKELQSVARKLVNKATEGGSLEPKTKLVTEESLGFGFYNERHIVEPRPEEKAYKDVVLDVQIVEGRDIQFTASELALEPDIINHRYLKYTLTYNIHGLDIVSSASNFALFDEDMKAPMFNSYRGHFIDSPLISKVSQYQDIVELPDKDSPAKFGSPARMVNILHNRHYKRGEWWYFPYISEWLDGDVEIYSGTHKGRILNIIRGSDKYSKYLKHANFIRTEDIGGGLESADWEGFVISSSREFYGKEVDIFSTDSFWGSELRFDYDDDRNTHDFWACQALEDFYIFMMFLESTTRSTQLLYKVENYLMRKFTA